MHRIVLTMIAAIALAGCDAAPPLEQATTANGVSTALVAVVDGCNVWAINRGGMSRTIYFARCPEGAADTSWSVNEGKAGVYDVQTVSGNHK